MPVLNCGLLSDLNRTEKTMLFEKKYWEAT
jgi:hypothetical protein